MRGAIMAGLAAIAATAAIESALAAGDLAVRPIQLDDLVLGTDDTGYGLSTSEYRLETGRAYRLKIVSTGKTEYALVAPELFANIWLRKVEAGNMEIKAMALTELEFEEEAEAELFFVPIRPGAYRMWAKQLEERGVVVTFHVE